MRHPRGVVSMRGMVTMGLAVLLFVSGLPAAAQNTREAERKLETIRRELKSVAAQRRQLEGQRGDATGQLRAADEQVGHTNRVLRGTESQLARDQAALAELRARRATLQQHLGDRRDERDRLLRAAYQQGRAAPLKVLLAQDRVADANRALVYHRYLQRDRAQRITLLTGELDALQAVEREIITRQGQLDAARVLQRSQLDQLERDRKARAALVAKIDSQYQDKASREQVLGRDAKGLERVLQGLRAAAARAEAQRRAVAAKAAREAARSEREARASGRPVATPRKPTLVAKAAPLQVGGLGWPLSGALLAGFGGTMPDGRNSEGMLIGANAGSSVKAVADGTVVYAEWMTGYGLLLIVDHGNGYMSLYAHNDALLKDVGAAVHRGEAVSTVGNSGGQGRPALYFELRRNGQPVNPNSWLRQ